MTDLPAEARVVALTENDAGLRLDAAVARALADDPRASSRARVKALFAQGRARFADGAPAEPARRARGDETLIVSLDAPPAPTLKPDPQALAGVSVVYEDDDVIIVNKPAGMLTHPAPGKEAAGGTLVHALVAHCGAPLARCGPALRPGIVHRLDKDTSGLLAAAKTPLAHARLTETFRLRPPTLTRSYAALVWGEPDALAQCGVWEGALARKPGERRFRVMPDAPRARAARTRWRIVRRWRVDGATRASLLRLRLETGRTHQARVHAARAGAPIIGDPLYAPRERTRAQALPEPARSAAMAMRRQALHARELGFAHPTRAGVCVRKRAPEPADFARLVAAFDEL